MRPGRLTERKGNPKHGGNVARKKNANVLSRSLFASDWAAESTQKFKVEPAELNPYLREAVLYFLVHNTHRQSAHFVFVYYYPPPRCWNSVVATMLMLRCVVRISSAWWSSAIRVPWRWFPFVARFTQHAFRYGNWWHIALELYVIL